jgi:hypothetical protein
LHILIDPFARKPPLTPYLNFGSKPRLRRPPQAETAAQVTAGQANGDASPRRCKKVEGDCKKPKKHARNAHRTSATATKRRPEEPPPPRRPGLPLPLPPPGDGPHANHAYATLGLCNAPAPAAPPVAYPPPLGAHTTSPPTPHSWALQPHNHCDLRLTFFVSHFALFLFDLEKSSFLYKILSCNFKFEMTLN